MAYVDLNSIRAKNSPIKPLYGLVGDKAQHTPPKGIPFSLIDYLELLDWTSRVLRDDKRVVVLGTQPQLLHVLGIDDETGCELVSRFGKNYHGAVGWLEELASYAEHTGQCWIAKKNVLHRCLH